MLLWPVAVTGDTRFGNRNELDRVFIPFEGAVVLRHWASSVICVKHMASRAADTGGSAARYCWSLC